MIKTIYIISFIFLLLNIITNNVYSEDNNQFINNAYPEDNNQFDIRYANTLSVSYFSNYFYNNIRSKHSTILDKPAFYIDEKFQIILAEDNDNNEIKTTDICWMSVPNSLSYLSINLLYSLYENFAVRTGVGFEAGLGGDYKNPFLCGGISLIYLHDMVFNNKFVDGSLFVNIGYKYDMHLFIDFSGALLDDIGLLTHTYYLDFELTLGYKEYIPLFLKIKGLLLINDDNKINYTDGIQYSYDQGIGLIHIQYYDDNFGLSIGYSEYNERYNEMILNAKQDDYIDYVVIDERHSKGGGTTFYIKNTDNSFEFFGEFHLLTYKKNNWMTISKLGATVYF